jgi:DNA repair exonuclease SbcCD ATPase subunit
MLRVQHEVEEKRQNLIALQGRINKMRSEEDRAKRHISLARRQADFISTLQAEKQRARDEKARLMQEQVRKEEESRRRLNGDRHGQM